MSNNSKLLSERRNFFQLLIAGSTACLATAVLPGCKTDKNNKTFIFNNIENLGPLLEADANGIKVPAQFSVKIIATSGESVAGTNFVWHDSPDGGATFPTDDGWIYVSNSEVTNNGGVGAIRFNSSGDIIDAYNILQNSTRNCSGGKTPWGTWLSCEELESGIIYECDPTGRSQARAIPSLGVFPHESAAVVPSTLEVYMTEDKADGKFYRFIPTEIIDGKSDFIDGTLQVAEVIDGGGGEVKWHTVDDPLAISNTTRTQVPQSTKFLGGEGIFYFESKIFFSTKHDNRIWIYDIETSILDVLYDLALPWNSALTGVDDIIITQFGDVIVAEDGGDMQIIAISPDKKLHTIAQVINQDESEVTGLAFSPDYKKLYFSSQRGLTGHRTGGITYEISGPFQIVEQI